MCSMARSPWASRECAGRRPSSSVSPRPRAARPRTRRREARWAAGAADFKSEAARRIPVPRRTWARGATLAPARTRIPTSSRPRRGRRLSCSTRSRCRSRRRSARRRRSGVASRRRIWRMSDGCKSSRSACARLSSASRSSSGKRLRNECARRRRRTTSRRTSARRRRTPTSRPRADRKPSRRRKRSPHLARAKEVRPLAAAAAAADCRREARALRRRARPRTAGFVPPAGTPSAGPPPRARVSSRSSAPSSKRSTSSSSRSWRLKTSTWRCYSAAPSRLRSTARRRGWSSRR